MSRSADTGAQADPSQRVKILMVDDRQDKLLALSSVFDGIDVDVITAQSGKEALRLVLANEFAVILLDVSMPIMDGFETATLIRQRQSSEHIPIIFITALNNTDTHASRGYSLGAVDYIFAPVIPDILRAKVLVFIDLFKMTKEIKRQGDLLRHEAEHRAVNLESRLDRLLNRLDVGVYRSTRAGLLISANPAFYRMFGYDPAVDPATINLTALYVHEEDRAVIIAHLEDTGQLHEHPVQQRRLDGTIMWVAMSKTLVNEATGQFIDGLVDDITAHKASEVALIAKAEELARSNDELAQFAYVASHDLQEPLRTMSSYVSLIEHRYAHLLDDKGRDYLNYVLVGARRMQQLIRDVLSYSKIGKLPTYIPVDCNALFDRVLFNLHDIIADSGAVVTRDELPTVMGDPFLLGQVFQNLLANALKFRHNDRIPTVHVGVKHEHAYWEFSVRDNGIGIASQYYEKIFSVFQRLNSREDYAGTGIGLAICRKAINHHHGTISVISEPQVGSVFRFLLPVTDLAVAACNPSSLSKGD